MRCRADEPSPDCASYLQPCDEEVQGDVDACLEQTACAALQFGSCEYQACVDACGPDDRVANCVERVSDDTCTALICALRCRSECTPDYIACQTPNVEGTCVPNTACTEEFDGCKADCEHICIDEPDPE